MLEALKSLSSNLIPLLAPSFLTAIGFPAAIKLTWAEVTGASSYQVFESGLNAYGTGVLIATVASNPQGPINAFLRTGLPDTNKRFYYVVPVSALGIPGAASPIAGSQATTVPVLPGTPIDQLTFGKLAAIFADIVVNGGQVDMSSLDVINKGEFVFKQVSLFATQQVTGGTITLGESISINTGSGPHGLSLGLSPNWTVKQGILAGGQGACFSIAGGADFRNSAFWKNWATVSGSNDHFAEVTILAPDLTSNNGLGPAVRVDPSVESYYGAYSHGVAGTWEVLKVVSGAVTSLSTGSYTPKAGDKLRLLIVGTTLSFYINGTLTFSTTDASLAAGAPGIHAAQSDVTSVSISQFFAGDNAGQATVTDKFPGINPGGKAVLLTGTLVVQTAAATTSFTLQFKRDGGNLNATAFTFSVPASSTVAIPFSYLDTGLQTGGAGGFAPGPISPGVHSYTLTIGTPSGTVTITDGYFIAATPAG